MKKQRILSKLIIGGLIFLTLLFQIGCQKKESVQIPLQELTSDQLFEKGKSIYTANCLSCHGPDPKKDGSIGPSIWGSSLELISARVIRAEYPEGHKPKRTTKLMVALPHLKEQVPALKEYLNK